MVPEGIVEKRVRQLDLFQERTSHLERLPRQTRKIVVELTADLIAVVWQATRETRAAMYPTAPREPGDE